MSGIVEELREDAKQRQQKTHTIGVGGRKVYSAETVLRAADEIERLQAELAEAREKIALLENLCYAPHKAIQAAELRAEALEADAARLRSALEVPVVWSMAERDGMAAAFDKADGKHGHYETLFAVGAWLLRHRQKQALATSPAAPGGPEEDQP